MQTHTALLLALLTAAAHAGPRTSADYAIATDTADIAGQRTTSANYTNAASAGGIIGLGTSTDDTAKHGYIGQLYDVTGLTLTAATLNVNETATLQLAAWQALDDATTLAVPAASVTWSVLNGPLSGISDGGLATAGTVYQNTNATAQGSYQSFLNTLTLTVLNVNTDDFGIYAGDGIADDWQVLYFGIGNSNAGPLLDPDHDGWINLFEYNARLVPTDPSSVFYFREETVAGQPGQRRIIFSPRLPGSTYTVQESTTIQPGSWQPLTSATVSDNGDERTVTDLNASGPRKFYRIEVQRP